MLRSSGSELLPTYHAKETKWFGGVDIQYCISTVDLNTERLDWVSRQSAALYVPRERRSDIHKEGPDVSTKPLIYSITMATTPVPLFRYGREGSGRVLLGEQTAVLISRMESYEVVPSH